LRIQTLPSTHISLPLRGETSLTGQQGISFVSFFIDGVSSSETATNAKTINENRIGKDV
jgi:hypothetical protein